MKSLYLLALATFFITSCNQFSDKGSYFGEQALDIDTVLYSHPTKITFRDTFYDLGDLKQGEKKEVTYYYTNSGDKPLILFSVRPGCGCTIADFNHKPIDSGVTDSIVAVFDSKNKEGNYIKAINVSSNAENKMNKLTFKVNVIK